MADKEKVRKRLREAAKKLPDVETANSISNRDLEILEELYSRKGSVKTANSISNRDLQFLKEAYGMRDGGMTEQMAEQMYMSEREAGGLMKKAKKINDADMTNMADGGMAEIQGTPPAQVKGFTYNDNGGKGTF